MNAIQCMDQQKRFPILNICRGILEKHDAEFGVLSEEGKGTTFWFDLPKAEQKKE